MPAHTITPPPQWATLSTTLTSANCSPTQHHTPPLPSDQVSSVKRTPPLSARRHRMWAFAHSSRLWWRTAVRSRPWWGRRACRWASLRRFLTVCAEILWLCKPIVAAAVRVAGLRRSWRWRCWMWRSWAGEVTSWSAVVRLGCMYCQILWNAFGDWLMVEKWTFNSRATALVDIPAVNMPIATSVTLCCVIKLHILEWPFIVASLRHTCAIITLSNQHLDTPHLWGGWIISAKEKCSLTQI